MYPLINKNINIDLLREIYHFNNYSDIDLEYFKFLHREKMAECLLQLAKAGDYYKEDEIEKRGIDFMEYLFDFTTFETKYKHRAVIF